MRRRSRFWSKKVRRGCASCRPRARDFDLEPGGEFKLGKRSGALRRRIVHAHGDQTGAEVARTLIERVRESKRIDVLEKTRVLDLIVRDGTCYRRAGDDRRASRRDHRRCDRARDRRLRPGVPLHDESAGRDGDGYAIAHRAGVKLADMEFVQFHPTALETPENPLALISEAVRGEGAVLVNDAGVRFMLEAAPAGGARAARHRCA